MARRIEVSQNELLEAIRAAQEPEYPDALTAPEICAALKLTRSKLRPLLATLEAAGRVRRVRVRRQDACSRAQVLPAYLIVPAR